MDIVLNPTSQEPIYTQIYNQICSQILTGKILPGTKLPSIRAISNELRISVIPVKMAWEELDKNGFIKTIGGSGTFVNEITENKIQSKKSRIAQDLVFEMCRQAKESGISEEELINLIRKFFTDSTIA